MSTAAAGLVAYPSSIEEGLRIQQFVAPRPRAHRRASSSGEWVTIGAVAVLTIGFVGLVLVPYLQRQGLGAQPVTDALRS